MVAVIGLLPASKIKNTLLRTLGWTIGPNASVGPGLYLNLDNVQLGRNSRIGPFNVIRDLSQLAIGEHAKVSQWNWISASRAIRNAGGPGSMSLGSHSSVTSRHYIDCSGGVEVGRYTTIAGMRSTLITHGIAWTDSMQTFDSITVDDYCLISSNVSITPGSRLGERVIVGMGSTVAGELPGPGLYVQPRASLIKSDLSGAYFERSVGAIAAIRSRR